MAEYSLEGFDGLSAMRLAKEVSPSVPIIFISGKLGEEVAIEALKSGAADYVLKHRLERLCRRSNGLCVRPRRVTNENAPRKNSPVGLLPKAQPDSDRGDYGRRRTDLYQPCGPGTVSGLVELGRRHPILADLASVDREIRESGGEQLPARCGSTEFSISG